MYCPYCGSELKDVDPQEETYRKAVRFKCTGPDKCFGEDYPLLWHQPFQGTESHPGDSWSLTWLK